MMAQSDSGQGSVGQYKPSNFECRLDWRSALTLAAKLECFPGKTSSFWLGLEVEVKLASHKVIVCIAFCTKYHSGVQDVSLVLLAH